MKQFGDLIDQARPGDQVVVLLAGHGSQQPDHEQPGKPFDEPDGLDEVFLPADAGPWDPDKEVIKNAVVDDEIRDWARKIVDRGAALWLIVDACHSGTGLRAIDDVVIREVRSNDLLIPDGVLPRARQQAAGRRLPPKQSAFGLTLPLDGSWACTPRARRAHGRNGRGPERRQRRAVARPFDLHAVRDPRPTRMRP